jgi:hypothetical protein
MKVNEMSKDRIVITSDCEMWTAVVQRWDNRNFVIFFDYDGERHHFMRARHATRDGAIKIAKEFVENNSK